MTPAATQVRGLQTPPIESVPPYGSSAGDEAIELAAKAGLHLDPWQQHVLRQALGERSDGKWASFEVALIVGRQNGKNAVLEALELAHLFLFGSQLILHTAHLFKTCEEAFRRILRRIEDTPFLAKRIKQVWRSHGNEGIELKNGARLRFIARSKGSGRGFTGDLVVLDEAMYLADSEMGDLVPTLSAVPNPQVWYTSSAGNQTSSQLGSVVGRGRKGGDPSLAYFEWGCSDTDPPDSPHSWAKANPSLGIRISEEHIARELLALDFTEFARERLGIGNYPSEEANSWLVINEGTWTATTDRDSKPLDPVAFAFDVTADRSYGSIAVAGRRTDGRRHIEIVDHQPGTAWIGDRLETLVNRWGPVGIGVDGAGPGGSLVAGFQDRGLTVTALKPTEYRWACGEFYDAVIEGRVRQPDDPVLSVSVRGAAQKLSGAGSWAWSRQDSSTLASPLVAATVAAYLHEHPPADDSAGDVWFLN